MEELKTSLSANGFNDVKSFIQSGNILLKTNRYAATVKREVETIINNDFKIETTVAVFTYKQWQEILNAAPKWWGENTSWKHNLIILIPPFNASEADTLIGELKPSIESLQPGAGVLYQSMSKEHFGKTTTSKLAKSQIYSKITIRNYNTAVKLGLMMAEDDKTANA